MDRVVNVLPHEQRTVVDLVGGMDVGLHLVLRLELGDGPV